MNKPDAPTRRSHSTTLRASELGSYLYCKRAWWYQRQGYPSDNTSEMQSGSQLHQQHGRSVFVAGLLRLAAYALLLAALVFTILHLADSWLGAAPLFF